MKEEPKAPEGAVWVCGACGKTSPKLYGGKGAMRHWDDSCAINAFLAKDDESLIRGDDKRVVSAEKFGV